MNHLCTLLIMPQENKGTEQQGRGGSRGGGKRISTPAGALCTLKAACRQLTGKHGAMVRLSADLARPVPHGKAFAFPWTISVRFEAAR